MAVRANAQLCRALTQRSTDHIATTQCISQTHLLWRNIIPYRVVSFGMTDMSFFPRHAVFTLIWNSRESSSLTSSADWTVYCCMDSGVESESSAVAMRPVATITVRTAASSPSRLRWGWRSWWCLALKTRSVRARSRQVWTPAGDRSRRLSLYSPASK